MKKLVGKTVASVDFRPREVELALEDGSIVVFHFLSNGEITASTGQKL